MELLAIRRAAVLFFMRWELMNPRGRAVHLFPKMIEHYRFLKFPQTFEEQTNFNDGVSFQAGEWEDAAVEEIRLYINGILIVTRESTDRSEALFADMMKWWAEEDTGLLFEPHMLSDKQYVSSLVVRSKVSLDHLLSSGVNEVMVKFFESTSGPLKLEFFTRGNPDVTTVRIERLAQSPGLPSQPNEFWTQTPFSTTRHMEFLTELEDAVIAARAS